MKTETYQDKDGQWRWRAIAVNGNIVADGGEGYHQQSDCWEGMRAAATALQEFCDALRWRDAKTEPPDDGECVLILTESGQMHTGCRDAESWILDGPVRLEDTAPYLWLPIPDNFISAKR